MKDEDGKDVRAGDVIRWEYGIPPVGVVSDIHEEGGELIAVHRDNHNPQCYALRLFRKHGIQFWRDLRPEEQAHPG